MCVTLLAGMILIAPRVLRADEPTKPDAAALKKRADEIFARSLERYQALRSYREKATAVYRMTYRDESGEDVGQNQEMKFTTIAAKPNRFKVVSDQLSMASDGKLFRCAMEGFANYMEVDAASGLSLPEELSEVQGAFSISPALAAMNGDVKDVWSMFPSLTGVTSIQNVDLDRVACERINMTMEAPMLAGDTPADVSVWIDTNTRMLKRIEVDYTKGAIAQREEMGEYQAASDPYADYKLERACVTYAIDEVTTDPALEDADFALKVSDDGRKVDSYMGILGVGVERPTIISDAAPPFESEDFDDKPIKLEDFRGKVVVLDFWATWCGPCVQAIPHVQKASERLKDKDVVFLGINRDQAGSEKHVRKFIEKKQITFRQVKDFDGDIANDYHVSSIPCTVLIGKDGVVQSFDVGFGAGGEDQLVAKVEKLLAGERLFDPEEIARQKASAETQETAPRSDALPDIDGERLVKGDLLSGASQLIAKGDLNGDGVEDYAFASYTGGRVLRILYGGREDFEKVKVKGIRPTEAIQSARIVEVNGKARILALLSDYQYLNGMANKVRIGAFSPDGESLWLHDLETPAKTTAQATLEIADLDDAPGPELIVSLSLFTMSQEGGMSYSQEYHSSYLLVIDMRGETRLRRHLGSQANLVAIIPGKPATLIINESYYGLRKYQLSPQVEQAQAKAEGVQP